MKKSIEIYICDVTGKLFDNFDSLEHFEVYQIGQTYDNDNVPEENTVITSISVDKELIPDTFGEHKNIYVDHNYSVALFGDENNVWKPKSENDTLVSDMSNAINKIMSDEYDDSFNPESIVIDGQKIK